MFWQWFKSNVQDIFVVIWQEMATLSFFILILPNRNCENDARSDSSILTNSCQTNKVPLYVRFWCRRGQTGPDLGPICLALWRDGDIPLSFRSFTKRFSSNWGETAEKSSCLLVTSNKMHYLFSQWTVSSEAGYTSRTGQVARLGRRRRRSWPRLHRGDATESLKWRLLFQFWFCLKWFQWILIFVVLFICILD